MTSSTILVKCISRIHRCNILKKKRKNEKKKRKTLEKQTLEKPNFFLFCSWLNVGVLGGDVRQKGDRSLDWRGKSVRPAGLAGGSQAQESLPGRECSPRPSVGSKCPPPPPQVLHQRTAGLPPHLRRSQLELLL